MSTPTTTKLIFWADQTHATTDNTLSALNGYNTIFVNLLTSPTGLSNYSGTTLTLPYTGGYLFEIGGWRCGSGTGQCKVVVTRSGSTIYQRVRSSAFNDCSVFTSQFFWHLFQAGDVATFYANTNNNGTSYPASIVGTTTTQNSTNDDSLGMTRIWFIPS
jgi:hypothetical protein